MELFQKSFIQERSGVFCFLSWQTCPSDASNKTSRLSQTARIASLHFPTFAFIFSPGFISALTMVVPSLTRPRRRKSGLRTKHTAHYERQSQERRRAAAIGGF